MKTRDGGWIWVAFLGSAGAAAIHFGAAPAHLSEWAPAGLFMAACGIAQASWALLFAARGGYRTAVAGLAMHSAIAGVWLVSRTVGMPFGPLAGVPEHVHGADAIATALEMLVVVSLPGALAGRSAPVPAQLAGWLGFATAALGGGHDPGRERVVALSALCALLVAHEVFVVVGEYVQGRRGDANARVSGLRIRMAGRAVLGAGRTIVR